MFDIGYFLGWYRQGDKFQTPDPTKSVITPYDFPSELGQVLQQSNISPFYVERINLTAAGEKLINSAGFHIVQFGNDGGDTHTPVTSSLVNVQFENKDPGSQAFPLKNNRGFSGPFTRVYLSWPAQPGVWADVVIYKGINYPWIGGETAT